MRRHLPFPPFAPFSPFSKGAGQPDPSVAFPGYASVTEIGSGAFAAVYRATEVATGRPVALKLLKVSARASRVMEAFDREVKSLGAVSSHPNIVTLYRTLTTADERPVLVLELCRESTADRVRRSGPLDPREAVAIGIKIAGALETAHRAGLLHRDMKPQNVLITDYGKPVLADFGLAALQASAQSTEGLFGFTTLHAAPEVLEGQRLSPATDVYGLASTLYQLISGEAPFSAFDGEAPAAVILRILRDPAVPLRLDNVPLSLSELLTDALAKRPEERPPTASAFGDALRGVEQASGWAPTAYAVWGDAALLPAAEVGHAGRVAAGSATNDPASEPGHEPGSEPRHEPARASRPGPAPAGGHERALGGASEPAGPDRGPSVVAPAAARRNVVMPSSSPAPAPRADAGAPGGAAPTAPPQPRPGEVPIPAPPGPFLGAGWPEPSTAASPPPVPPEPSTAASPPPVPPEGVYERTMTPMAVAAAMRASNTPATTATASPPTRSRAGLVGLATAVVVVLVLAVCAALGLF
ncbi:MAG TPA: protein kinase [Acidimicrobiales bacterium]|nr:protein kinase [Acidimicrobiales bacterium]